MLPPAEFAIETHTEFPAALGEGEEREAHAEAGGFEMLYCTASDTEHMHMLARREACNHQVDYGRRTHLRLRRRASKAPARCYPTPVCGGHGMSPRLKSLPKVSIVILTLDFRMERRKTRVTLPLSQVKTKRQVRRKSLANGNARFVRFFCRVYCSRTSTLC